jgi:Protein of unknown function (DUF1761)
MILDYFGDLNWLAILVAAVAWFAFSAAWYSVPPLSNAWMRAAKVTPTEGPPLVSLLFPTFVGYFVTSTVIAMLAKAIGAATFADGLALGIVLGIGFGVVGALVTQLYEQKGGTYWLINGVNAIIAYSIVSVIVTLWD